MMSQPLNLLLTLEELEAKTVLMVSLQLLSTAQTVLTNRRSVMR